MNFIHSITRTTSSSPNTYTVGGGVHTHTEQATQEEEEGNNNPTAVPSFCEVIPPSSRSATKIPNRVEDPKKLQLYLYVHHHTQHVSFRSLAPPLTLPRARARVSRSRDLPW